MTLITTTFIYMEALQSFMDLMRGDIGHLTTDSIVMHHFMIHGGQIMITGEPEFMIHFTTPGMDISHILITITTIHAIIIIGRMKAEEIISTRSQ